jgi:hypothetical protein
MNDIKLIEYKTYDNTQRHRDAFKKAFSGWEEYVDFGLHPNFYENVVDIRSGMTERITLKSLPELEYKKAIIKDLKNEYQELEDDGLNFTDEELTQNRILNGKNRDQKITKYINNIIKERYQHRTEQRLDYFHKPKHANNEYYIDKDPISLMDAYLKVDTCVSPNGSNQSNMLKFLMSPYIYIATDKRKSVRILIYADFNRKVVFLNALYGSYDYMMPLVIVKYFVEQGFTFSTYVGHTFNDEFLTYKDRQTCEFENIIKYYNGKETQNLENKYQFNTIDLFKRPSWVQFKGDGLIKNNRHLNTTTEYDVKGDDEHITETPQEYCGNCGYDVHPDEYHYDEEMCSSCFDDNYRYCETCDRTVDADRYNYDEDMCNVCHAEHLEEVEAEKQKEQEKEETLDDLFDKIEEEAQR